MSEEMWKDILGFPGYQASSLGNVRSFKKKQGKGWIISDKPQRILSPSCCRFYRRVLLSNNGIVKGRHVAALVLLAFVGDCPKGQEIRHLNGNSKDDRLSNLSYGTKEQNFHDMKRHRVEDPTRYIKGKLPVETVLAIRKQRASGALIRELAEKHHLGLSTISDICSGRNYKYLGGPLTPPPVN